MNGYDFFFSHHSDSSKALVAEVARILQGSGIRGWYAERDIEGSQNYTEMIMSAIRESRLFVLLLNKYSNTSRHVIREVNVAMSNARPMLFLRIDDCTPSDAIAYASSASQIITIKEENSSLLAKKLSEEIFHWFATHGESTPGTDTFSDAGYKSTWDRNELAFYEDEGERHRIEQQRRFIYDFAHETYDALLGGAPEGASFLDVGGNTGEQCAMLLKGHEGLRYICVDREEKALTQGRALFPDAHFYQADCETDAFEDLLDEIRRKHAPRGFDFINVSLLLLHTKKPERLLDRLSNHLSPNGRLIILDIDDGFNVAHPDPEGRFAKAVELCFPTAYSGFRHCGRTVFGFLSDLGLSDIRLHKTGLSTIGMNRRERESFFDIYFWIILDDLRKMHASHPESTLIKNDLDWIEANYEEMRMAFKKKNFFFSLGFMLFSAGAEE